MSNVKSASRGRRRPESERMTFTLSDEQKRRLEEIAAHNRVSLGHVLRYAVQQFLSRGEGGQLKLEFPP
jgi:predicted transcriptional regulator